MRKAIVPGSLFLAVLAGPAAADDAMYQILPGLMCESPEALARLTLPDGSSRTSRPHPAAADLEVRSQGKCVEMSGEVSGALVTRRVNTSIITVDAGDGKGPKPYYVPNIDFSLSVSNVEALRASTPPGAIPKPCYGLGKVTFSAIIKSAPFTPDSGQPYRYRYLLFPSPVCVTGLMGTDGVIAILASLKGDVKTASIPDGSPVTVRGEIATIDTGNQPLTLQFLADAVSRR